MLIEIDNDLNVAEYKKISGFYPQPDLPYEYNYLPTEFSGITTKGVKYPRDIALVFSDSGKRIRPKEGKYVIFPGYLKHHVPKHRYTDTRITLSGNFTIDRI